jgi:CheY-specific phosphatase CheX
MLRPQIQTQTVRVISRIVGDAAFMFADELKPEARPEPALWKALGVRLDFSGEAAGNFRLWVGTALAQQFAVNMLGLEADDTLPDAKKHDALREMLNIIVGNFLTGNFGEKAVFAMGIPQLLQADRLAADCLSADALWLSIEGQPVLCVVEIE